MAIKDFLDTSFIKYIILLLVPYSIQHNTVRYGFKWINKETAEVRSRPTVRLAQVRT
jgi:hypothetical protein